jgi:transcriptional regulator with XRE-family HTH domain
MKTLGQRIRELREEADLSLREFARRLDNLSPAFVSDVELNRRHPTEKMLGRMAEVLGTTAEELKIYDARPPVQEIKDLSVRNPSYGVAFRKFVSTVAEKDIKPEEIVRIIERWGKEKK